MFEINKMVKKAKNSLTILALCLLLSCNHTRTEADYIKLGKSNEQYNSLKEYYEKNEGITYDNDWIKFKFLNNPYNLGDKNIVSIYINEKLVYRGIYKQLIVLKGDTNDIFCKDRRMVIRMEILTDKTKRKIWLRRFVSKEVFSWNESYKIIYCVFCPTNESVENVFFIPQFNQ